MRMKLTMTRRRLITLASRTISLAVVSFAFIPRLFMAAERTTGTLEYNTHEMETLVTLAHDLFPHDGLPESVYREVAATVKSRTVLSRDVYELMRDGIRDLDGAADGDTWKTLVYDRRIELLANVEQTAFFLTLRNLVADVLYQHPAIWKRLGYGGNALAQGGYLERGFNDINWLPKETGNG